MRSKIKQSHSFYGSKNCMGVTCLMSPLPGHTVLLDIGSTHPNGTVPLLGGGFDMSGSPGWNRDADSELLFVAAIPAPFWSNIN
jgi:hypothetical protein